MRCLLPQYKYKFFWSLILTFDKETVRSLASTVLCGMVEACSVKMPALTWGKGDWKINGVCDWQPMILGIRLNWIRPGESVGHNPRIHWDTLTVNTQKQFLPSLSLGYKAWLQNTSSPWSPTAWRVSNPNQLKHFKPASHSVPIPRSLYLQRICWWPDVK